jgi:hypothetical protein
MEKNPTILRRLLLICLLVFLCFLANAQTIFQDAMHLNTLREHYEAYCRAIANQDNVFSEFRKDLLDGKTLPVPRADGPLREEIKVILGAQDGNSGFGTNDNWATGGTKSGTTAPAATSGPALEAQIQKVAQEWALIEEYLLSTNDSLHLENESLDALAPMAGGFTYLDDISARASGQASATAAATSGTFTSLLGISEADVIMGIVDWTIKQAKEELVKAFLGEFLDRIKGDSALVLLFPNTLNMLETTDITTIFSNGDVWKAAFKQDLDAMPSKMYPVVSLLLRNLPPKTLSADAKKEILGATRIATDIYQSIGQGNTVEDVLSTLTARSMLVPDTALSVLEKGVILTSAILEAITTVDQQKLTFVTPGAIAGLDSTELMDLWNLMFITLQPKLDKVFEGTDVDSFYHKVANELPLFQYAVMQVSDIIQTIKQLTDPGVPASAAGSAKKLDMQETDRYFQLSLDLVDQGVDLLDSLGIIPAKDAAYYENTVRPIAVDVMNGVEGVATQQYGMVITSLIDIVERLNLKGGNVAAAVAEAVALVARLKREAQGIGGSSDVNGDLNQLAQSLVTFRTQHGNSLASNPVTADFKNLLDRTIAELVSNNLGTLGTSGAAQKFVEGLVEDLEKELQQAIKDLEDELESTELGHYINTYGRFVVNILTAKNSDDIEAILNEFAMGTGGYMVKQTSASAFTVTFLPGVAGGAELLQVRDPNGGTTYNIGAFGGATLPIGIEYSIGIPNCKLLGAIGIYGQAADLGAVLNYRLTNTDTVPVTPQIGFQQVLSPGAAFLMHFKNVPIVFGAGLSYSPALREVSSGGATTYEAHSLRLGASITVDVTVFQLWASKRKLGAGVKALGQVR